MKLALMSKAMLCVCPPALIATSVATVPPVRRAVHRLTQPHHAPAKRVHRRARPHVAQAAAPCGRGAVDRPAVPFLTYAEPGPADTGFSSSELPLGGGGGAGASPQSFGPGPVFAGGPGTPGLSGPNPGVSVDTPAPPATPTPVETPTPTPTTPVPEPATWVMMILGAGLTGFSLRRNRQKQIQPRRRGVGKPRMRVQPVSGWGRVARRLGYVSAFADGALLPAIDPVNAGAVVSANSAKSAMLAKVLMCVCPPAIIATSVATVPPVRKAVYTATAPRGSQAARPRTAAAVPCDPALAEVTAPSAVARAGGI